MITCQSIKQLLLNVYIIVLESTDNVEYTDKQLCFDDLIQKQIIRLRIIDQSKTKTLFIIIIISSHFLAFTCLQYVCTVLIEN